VNVNLIHVGPEGQSNEIPMKKPRLVIGRREGADIRIPTPNVSREHCELTNKDGRLVVRDLGSSNGTYVNRQRVQEQALKAGDLIGVGPAVFVVQIAGEPAQIQARTFFEEGAAPAAIASQAPAKPTARPASPAAAPAAGKASAPSGGSSNSASPGGKPAAKPVRKSLLDDDDDDFDIGPGASGSGSFADLDFDLDDEDDEPKTKLDDKPGKPKK
jgi:predicted component of type VI protein secretion system